MNGRRSRLVFLAALTAAGATCVLAVTSQQRLMVRLDGDYLRISVDPHLSFLKDRVLEKLKDGASVAFVGQLTIAASQNALVPEARSVARFALSYDIWATENWFSVTKIGERSDLKHSKSHLTAEATENWCLDNLTIERSQIPADRPFYVELDLRQEDPRDQLGIVGESGLNITQVIEWFRTPARGGQKPISLTAGPLRMADLRKAGQG